MDQVLGNYVEVEFERLVEQNIGGIIVTSVNKPASKMAYITGVGTGENGKKVELPEGINIGDKVVIEIKSDNDRIGVKMNNGKWKCYIPMECILAKVEE